MADRGRKAFERRLCRDVWTERIPVTGERNGADGTTNRFAFQFKLRRSLPAWIFAWLAGICASAARSGKIGVLIVKRPRMRDDDALVMLRWSDWIDLQGVRSEACVIKPLSSNPGRAISASVARPCRAAAF